MARPSASPSARRLDASTFERVERHLSTEGIFLLGDAQARGFPIRYASRGFEDVYGYSASEMNGKTCGDLIGGRAIVASIESLAAVAKVASMSLKEAEARILFLTAKASEACEVMMSHSGSRVGVSLVLNRKKSGAMFVCECLVLNLKHPKLDWSYCVGFQQDISAEVPPCALLAAAEGDSAYTRLVQSRAPALAQRREVLLGVGSEHVIRFLHEKAMDVFSLDIWRTLRSELMCSVDATACADACPQALVPQPEQPFKPVASPAARSLRAGGMGVPEVSSPTAAIPGSSIRQRDLSLAAMAKHSAVDPLHLANLAKAVGRESTSHAGGTAALAMRENPASHHLKVPSRTHGAVSPWQVMETNSVVEFLNDNGLRKYAESLILSGFDDMDTLVEISDEDIKDLGIPRGHALKLKRCLRAFHCLQICGGHVDMPEIGQNLTLSERTDGVSATVSAEDEVASASSVSAQAMQALPRPASISTGFGDEGVGRAVRAASGTGIVAPQRNLKGMKTAVEASWEQVQAFGADHFGELLFEQLFHLDPAAQDLFPSEVCEKYSDWTLEAAAFSHAFAADGGSVVTKPPSAPKLFGKAVNLIGGAVVGLHVAQHLVPNLIRLGSRHAGYGVTASHLHALGRALTQTLRRVLGEACTPEVELAWVVVYKFVSATMVGGLQQGDAISSELASPARTSSAHMGAAPKPKEADAFAGNPTWVGDSASSLTVATLMQKLHPSPPFSRA